MCGRCRDEIGRHALVEQFGSQRLPVVFPEALAPPNLLADLDARATQDASIFRPRAGGPMMLAGLWDRANVADCGAVESSTAVT